jgi:hypothetical protein
MTRVQVLEHEIKKLNRSNLAMFRDWFLEFDSDAWDKQIRKDVRSGKLKKLADQALASHRAGKTREL